MKAKKPTYDRHSTLTLEVGLAAIRGGDGLRVTLNGVSVKRTSLRLATFATKGTTCIACGIEGGFFAIERSWSDRAYTAAAKPYHLNLWAVREDGALSLMTHDHLHARSTGGADEIDNSFPMCDRCNRAKSIEEGRLARALMRD